MLLNKVKQYRIELGISQIELSDSVGVTRQTMSLIEKGDYNPTIGLCLRICYRLNKTLDEIFFVKKEDFIK